MFKTPDEIGKTLSSHASVFLEEASKKLEKHMDGVEFRNWLASWQISEATIPQGYTWTNEDAKSHKFYIFSTEGSWTDKRGYDYPTAQYVGRILKNQLEKSGWSVYLEHQSDQRDTWVALVIKPGNRN